MSEKTGIATTTDGTTTGSGIIMRIGKGTEKIDIGKGKGDFRTVN
jgi:hypothetical protein